jgi:hypothetical protein
MQVHELASHVITLLPGDRACVRVPFPWPRVQSVKIVSMTVSESFLQPGYLAKRGVERIDDSSRIILCCKTCGQRWFPDLLPGGRLSDRFWQCPNDCSELISRFKEGRSYILPDHPDALGSPRVEASFNLHTGMWELHTIGSHPGKFSHGFFVVSVERGELLHCPYPSQVKGEYPGLASTRIMIRNLRRSD